MHEDLNFDKINLLKNDLTEFNHPRFQHEVARIKKIKMKKKIIIIGNGFDLNLGLPTSYSHFLKSLYFDELLEDGNQIANNLKNRSELENWVDVEVALKDYADNINNLGSKILSSFKEEYKELAKQFLEYLKSIKYDKINKKSKAYNFITNNSVDKYNKTTDILIYNFNYTSTVKNILANQGWSSNDIAEKHIHVHGDLESNIIFGIQDDTKSTKFHTFIKKTTGEGFQRCDLPENLKKGYDIAIFGYSLGVSDEMYFKNPFNWLSQNENISKLHMDLYYFGENSKDELDYRMDQLTNSNLADFLQSVFLEKIDISKLTK
ncbi:MAG: hypothetical protein KAR54_00820 [Candidatus Pacebacteria bacterium]|nr:hypothetical protein [Candidatus Paceibacterota bacterium]